jgi:hypothetical protein
MSRLARWFAFLIAFLPAVWGNCPGLLTGRCCCAPVRAAAKAPCCPACRERSEKSRPPSPCSGCRCTDARDGSTPAPQDVDAPHADTSLVSLPRADAAAPAAVVARSVNIADIRPPGGPPDLVGVVVLLI